MKISVIIIARNEERHIRDAISSVAAADEVIVVDNNSSDKTAKIAKEAGAKVYSLSGIDFSYLRNFGREKARSEWLFYIDADERPTSSLVEEITRVVKTSEYAAYTVNRQNYFFGKQWGRPEKMVRLLRKNALIGWQGSLHESPHIVGKIGKLSGVLNHFTHSDISSMVEKTNEWSEIESRLRYKNNHPDVSWWRFLRIIITSFWQSYIVQGGWKSGTYGLIEAIYQSFSMFITYAKLWEKQHKSVRFTGKLL